MKRTQQSAICRVVARSSVLWTTRKQVNIIIFTNLLPLTA